ASPAVGGQPPQVGPPDQHRPRAECERLDHVAAPANAAVEQNLNLVADRVRDTRPRADGRGRSIEVVTTMVGYRDGAHAGVDGALGLIDPDDALEQKRSFPLRAQPADVGPAGWRSL